MLICKILRCSEVLRFRALIVDTSEVRNVTLRVKNNKIWHRAYTGESKEKSQTLSVGECLAKRRQARGSLKVLAAEKWKESPSVLIVVILRQRSRAGNCSLGRNPGEHGTVYLGTSCDPGRATKLPSLSKEAKNPRKQCKSISSCTLRMLMVVKQSSHHCKIKRAVLGCNKKLGLG
jgi:hypothetical protein